MIKKILTISTIAVLATFIMTISMTNVAQADDPEKKTDEFKCDKGFGSFFNPTLTSGVVYSGAWVDCSVIGSSGLASALEGAGLGSEDHCLALASPAGLDSFISNEKGFISFTVTAEQCFFDDDGDELASAAGFCEDEGPNTSTLTGTYRMTGGIVDGKRVIDSDDGVGVFTASVDHCAGDSANEGNFGTFAFFGDIVTQDTHD